MAKAFTYTGDTRHFKVDNRWFRVVSGRGYSVMPNAQMRGHLVAGKNKVKMSQALYEVVLAEVKQVEEVASIEAAKK